VQILVGHENGLSAELSDACGARVTLPQYGSVGSLSMNNALGVALARATAVLCEADSNPAPPARLSTGAALAEVRSPLSTDPFNVTAQGAVRPHTDDLMGLSDAEVTERIADRRRLLPLQLGIAWDNMNADRNIGATVRSANAYNCEHFIVVGRRKFSRRGTLGTHNYTPTKLVPSWDAAAELADGHEIWALWNDAPYLLDHLGAGEALPAAHAADLRAQGALLSCDRTDELISAMRSLRAAGKRGVTLVVPEEGCSHTEHAWGRCDRVLTLASRAAATQRGIAPAVAATVALERLRFASLFA
jgi:hypothetical protein